MKKLLIIGLLLVSAQAYADVCDTCITLKPLQFSTQLSTGQEQGQAQGQEATSASTATNAGSGNGNTINFNTPGNTTSKTEISGTQTIRNVPSVSGPPLTTSNDTCMGSTSGSLNLAGLGIGGGSTWVDNNCKRLKNARELWNMGMKGAGMALMCKDPENREALESTGYVCPARKEDTKSTSNTSSATTVMGGH